MRKCVSAAAGVFLGLALAGPAAADDIGDVTRLLNEARAIQGDDIRGLAVESDLFGGELVRTGAESRLHARFADGTELMMGAQSVLQLDSFVYDPENGGTARFNLTSGAFRMITGALNKTGGGALEVNTPVATIGVRGTDFWGLQTDEQLTLALLDDGVLEVSAQGRTVTMDQAMTVLRITRADGIGEIQPLSEDALAEAAQTVAIPE
jgi:hypothetical protein